MWGLGCVGVWGLGFWVWVWGSGVGSEGLAFCVSCLAEGVPYRGTSLIKERLLLGPYSRTMPKALWWS